jgi:hypothetical protein
MNWLRPEPFPDLQIGFRLFPNPDSLSNPLLSCIAVTGFITYGIRAFVRPAELVKSLD